MLRAVHNAAVHEVLHGNRAVQASASAVQSTHLNIVLNLSHAHNVQLLLIRLHKPPLGNALVKRRLAALESEAYGAALTNTLALVTHPAGLAAA